MTKKSNAAKTTQRGPVTGCKPACGKLRENSLPSSDAELYGRFMFLSVLVGGDGGAPLLAYRVSVFTELWVVPRSFASSLLGRSFFYCIMKQF